MLDVEVVPELAIRHKAWEFILGMPIQQMIDILRKQDQLIKNVNFWYNEKDPFGMNLILVLPNDGLKFHFDPYLQRLLIIEVFDLSAITLRYWSQYFNSPSIVPTAQEILRIFGSTKPPTESDEGYQLSYRGITFLLSKFSSGLATNRDSPVSEITNASHLVEDKSDYIVTRLFIYLGSNLSDAKVSTELPSACYLQNVFLEKLEVKRSNNVTKKLIFHLVAQDLNVNPTHDPQICRFTRSLQFGYSVQDVLSALGSPSRIFYKTEDKMKIHLPQSHRLEQPRRSDYFFNYFTLGLDILFNALNHTIIKFVLHTNQPGEYTFNTYYRCAFEIPLSYPSKYSENLSQNLVDVDSGQSTSFVSESDKCAKDDNYLVTPFSKWSDIQKHLDPTNTNIGPVVIYRESKPRNNPFRPTHAYGYQDMIFEIIPSSECVVSVTFYAPIDRQETQG